MKELHFLPVLYRIKFKLCTVVYKCLNNLAPKYLADLLTVRVPNIHQLRTDNDFFLLDVPSKPNLQKTENAFSHSGPREWNSLPYSIRARSDYTSFKNILKTHFFKMAYVDLISADEMFFL